MTENPNAKSKKIRKNEKRRKLGGPHKEARLHEECLNMEAEKSLTESLDNLKN